MPDVSVIVPNYNHAPFLEQRIESIYGQTFKDFDLTVLDDHSSDGSMLVLKSLQRKYGFTLIKGEYNSGIPFKQWNKGVGATSGEYIWIAESDDYAHCLFLETMIAVLKKHKNIGFAYCESWVIDSSSVIIGTSAEYLSRNFGSLSSDDFIDSGLRILNKYLMIGNIVPNASSVLLRRSIYEKAGGAPENYHLSGDWLLWAKMLSFADVAFIKYPYNFFRSHIANVRSSVKPDEETLEYDRVRHAISSLQDNLLKPKRNCRLKDLPVMSKRRNT
jgi:glycosyltransferase involved in cell wall biosynthesis